MDLNFQEPGDINVTTPSFLFLGNPGTGKTTLIGQAAKFLTDRTPGSKFLVLNMEPKDKRATPAMRELKPGICSVLDSPKWDEIMQVMTASYKDFQAGLAIDGLAGYARECMYDVMGISRQSRENIGQSHLPHQNQWHIWGERLRNHIFMLVNKDIPVVVTSHVKFDQDQLSGEIYKSVNTWGKPAVEMPAFFTVSGICTYVASQKESWEIKFRPERGFPARDTLGRLDKVEPLDFEKLWKKLMAEPIVRNPVL